MKIIMDIGTTNARIYLCNNEFVKIDTVYLKNGGVNCAINHTKVYFINRIKDGIIKILNRNNISEKDVLYIAVLGMGTSERGLCDIEHLKVPVAYHTLVKRNISELSDIPFVFIPGIKKCDNDGHILAMMRGEETQVAGIVDKIGIKEKSVIILPGTHNEIIVTQDGKIVDFMTTMSGELLECIMNNTILKGAVRMISDFSKNHLLAGADYCKENGFNSAVLRIRSLLVGGGLSIDELSSFYYGVLLYNDMFLIKKYYSGLKMYLGGKDAYKKAFSILLEDENIELIDDKIIENAAFNGAKYFLSHNFD